MVSPMAVSISLGTTTSPLAHLAIAVPNHAASGGPPFALPGASLGKRREAGLQGPGNPCRGAGLGSG